MYIGMKKKKEFLVVNFGVNFLKEQKNKLQTTNKLGKIVPEEEINYGR